jgi:hypothetical protein
MALRWTWLLATVVAFVLAAPAGAATTPATTTAPAVPGVATTGVPTLSTQQDPNALTRPASLDVIPDGHRMTGRQALETAQKLPKVVKERAKHKDSTVDVFEKGQTRWQVSFYDSDHNEIAQVLIDDASGIVTEAWTGPQVAWTMARGYPGAFGRKAAAAYVWIPLLVLFVLPFVDWRHPLRMRHLDLLMLCSLSVSLAFFSHGNLAWSVPTEYPPLVYLLARLLWIGLRRNDTKPTRGYLLVPTTWLAIAIVFLVGFRIGLNVTDSNVIDVGYSGVIGADKITHGQDLYGNWPTDNQHGDTYGPVNYLTYIPFEQLWPWHGAWDDLPAAHGAAIFFDLLCLGGLFLLGRRLRGPTLGIVLAYAWAAFPFTLFSLATNSNDSLVAAFLIGALLVATSAPARGVFAALAGFTKFAPLLLAPLLATHGTVGRPLRERVKPTALFCLAFAITAGIVLLPVWLENDYRTVWDSTVGFQFGRGAPFSVWGYYGGLDGVQLALQVATIVFALAAAFIPRRPDVIGLAALGGALLLMLQLGMTYWFYLYIVWVVPLAFVALFGRDAEPGDEPEPPQAPAPAAEPVPLALG